MQKNSEIRFLKSIGPEPEFDGIRLICSYNFKKQASPESDKLTTREEIIAHFDNGVIKNGTKIKEIGIDGQLFMNDLTRKVKEKGAILKQCFFQSLQDILSLEEPVVINCTSMGSITIFNDQEFIPVRGQIVYFKTQANFDYLYFQKIDNNSEDVNLFFVSIYPCSDRIVLGGVYEYDETEAVAIPEVINRIIHNAEKCLSAN